MADSQRREKWIRRKQHVRRQLRNQRRTLLTVYRSRKHIYALLVDPITGRTLTSVSTRSPALREALTSTCDVGAARAIGVAIARCALEREIEKVDFNRNGFVYTGRIKALADGAREAGLSF